MLEIWGSCLLGPLLTPMLIAYGQPTACGYYIDDPDLECFFQRMISYGPKSEKVYRCT